MSTDDPATTAGDDWGTAKDEVRQNWAAIAPRWHAWHPLRPGVTSAATVKLMNAANLEPGLRVLDLASGGGEPAIQIARAVEPGGTVTATDLVEEMLAPLSARAQELNIANLSCRIADAESLPFAAGSYDRVTCRFGVMFFPDLPQAMREAHRVLAPGGRIALCFFGQREHHQGIHAILQAVAAHTPVPAESPDRPGMFRLGDPAPLVSALDAAGFVEVAVHTMDVAESAVGAAESYLERRDRTFKKHVKDLPAAEQERARADAIAALRTFEVEGAVRLQARIHILTARREGS